MKKIIVLMIISLLMFSAVGIADDSQPEKVRVFVKFKSEPNINSINLAGGKVLHSYSLLENVVAVEVPANALNGLLLNPNVVSVEYDTKVQASGKPSPSQPVEQLPWGVNKIGADLANGTGVGVTVCVIDTGINQNHPDLQANIAGGRNFAAKGAAIDPNKWNDDNGHGTHVAGTIAALDNSIGVIGVAPQASLLAAKVLNRQGSGYTSDVIAGIEYCVLNNAKVISMSLGSSSDVQALHDAVDAAYSSGSLLVAAAGNDYGGAFSYPAAYSSVIAVSATDSNDNLASFSNLGPEVELAAPGVSILSTWKNGGYNTISGTSMATPHVSGVTALAMEANPLLTNADIRVLLQNTADDLGAVGRDNLFGFGLVDAELN